jgi:hypothetical protein
MLLTLAALDAAAAPVVTVKGRTTLRFIGIYPGDDGAILVGELKDKDLGIGIPDKLVKVSLVLGRRWRTFRVRTDAEGQFRLTLPPGQQAYRLEARFPGDATYAPVNPPETSMDMTKLTPEIELDINRELSVADATHQLKILTRAEGKMVSLKLRVRVEGGADLATVTTDPTTGRAEVAISTARLGGPGPATLVVRFAGNSEYNPATAQTEVVLTSTVQVTLRASSPMVHTDETVQLSGRVSDPRGPISGATISLEAMGRHVSSTLTEEDGTYVFELRAKDFPPGPLDLAAHFTPTVLWRRPASSPALKVTILPPTPIPVHLYAIPVAVTALIMLALVLVRFWPALQRKQPEQEEEAPLEAEPAPEPIASGVRLSRTSLRSFVKPAFDIHGVVWDPVDRCPVREASVRVEQDGGTVIELATDRQGRFNIPALPPGTHKVTVSRLGFVSESFKANLPHRGNLHGVRVDMVQVRVRLLELYRNEVAIPLLPRERLWARWTPRELCRHVGANAGRRNPGLEGLTRMLERAYWSPYPASEEILQEARSLVDTLS